MTTQWERDRMREEREARRLHALVEAATDAARLIDAGKNPTEHDALVRALAPFDLKYLRQDVAHADAEDARRQAEADNIAKAVRLLDESPDAPARMQCEAFIATDMGRWTQFGRCDREAKRVVLDQKERRERAVCTQHAKLWLRDGSLGLTAWYDAPHNRNKYVTNLHWYRVKGWCMVPIEGKFCTVKVNIASNKHDGPHKAGREPYGQRQGVGLGPVAQRA